jgi:hypothetical protein
MDGNHPSPPLILKLAMLRCLQWLVGVRAVDAPVVGVPIMIAAHRHPIMQGWAPPVVRHCQQPCESLSCADAHLGLLLCCDTSLCLLISIGPRLLRMRLSLSCKSSSLLGRGSSTAERVPSSHGHKDCRLLFARSRGRPLAELFHPGVHLTALSQALAEPESLLCLQETNLEVREVIQCNTLFFEKNRIL